MLALAALPEFVIGVIILVVFAVYFGLFPVSSAVVLYGSLGETVRAYILPAATLALVVIPHMTRQIRVTIREVSSAPYVRAAELRGLPLWGVTWHHIVPTASGRVVNVVALNLAELLAGVVVVETVFSFPGVGRQLVEAINANDVTVVQAVALVIGSAYIIVNFFADFLVVLLNPRLRRAAQT